MAESGGSKNVAGLNAKFIEDINDLIQSLRGSNPEIPSVFQLSFLSRVWDQLNKTLAPKYRYDVSEKKRRRKEMVAKMLEFRSEIVTHLLIICEKFENRGYTANNTLTNLNNFHSGSYVNVGVEYDGKIIRAAIGYAFGKHINGDALVVIIQNYLPFEIVTKTYKDPYYMKIYKVISHPSRLLGEMTTEDRQRFEKDIDMFHKDIPTCTHAGNFLHFIKANNCKRSRESSIIILDEENEDEEEKDQNEENEELRRKIAKLTNENSALKNNNSTLKQKYESLAKEKERNERILTSQLEELSKEKEILCSNFSKMLQSKTEQAQKHQKILKQIQDAVKDI